MLKKLKKGSKPVTNGKKAAPQSLGKPKVPQSAAEARKAAAASAGKLKVPPKRILILGGAAVALVILVLLVIFGAPPKKAPPGAPPQATALLPLSVVPEQPGVSPPGGAGDDRNDFPAIRTIRFEPPQPTRMDTLKAEVLTEAPDPGSLTYAYVWKVNDRIVEGAAGDTLDLSTLDLKKKDLLTVSVTPHDGERAGFEVESPVVAVHSIPPTLDMKIPRQTRKASEPLEIQLVSLHPDSDGVTFSLEAPLVPGMSIDPNSGKITWIIQTNQKGTIPFGAVVEDTEKTRVTRIFNITVEKSSIAPAPAGAGTNSRSTQ